MGFSFCRSLWGFDEWAWLILIKQTAQCTFITWVILYFAILFFHNKKKSKSLVNAHAFGFHVKRKDNFNQYIRGILVIYSVSDVCGHPTNTGAKPRLPSNKQNHFYIDIWYSWLHLLVKIQIDYKSSSSVNSLKVTQPVGGALCTERIPVRDGRASHHPEHLIMKLRIIFAFFFFNMKSRSFAWHKFQTVVLSCCHRRFCVYWWIRKECRGDYYCFLIIALCCFQQTFELKSIRSHKPLNHNSSSGRCRPVPLWVFW